MKRYLAIPGSLALLAVAALCVFGFLATFEPTGNAALYLAFRIGYAMAGIACLIGAGLLAAKILQGRNGRWGKGRVDGEHRS